MTDNFNYISFGSQDYVAEAVDEISMPLGRMFEYTATDTLKRLETLDSKAVAYLQQLPTFLCSEIARRDGRASMVIKFVRLDSIELTRKEVEARFEVEIDFGEVWFDDVDAARAIFEADPFQLYRTHWAVRDGDVHEILVRLLEHDPGQVRGAAGVRPEGAVPVEPPPVPVKTTLGEASSVESFLQLLYGTPEKASTETFFRGHDDETFELTPSLLRKREDGAWKFLPNEDRLCKELLIAHYEEFQGDQYCFDRLVRMQHYDLPTRLLDITSNPLVALFFACRRADAGPNINGEVVVFRVATERVKYYDSDTASCLANLSNLTHEQKNQLNLSLDVEEFNKTPMVQKLVHHIRSEKGFFEGRILPDDLGSILCVKAKRTNDRIKSQSGAFLLFGHDAKLSESGQEDIEIDRVTITDKDRILDQLDRININATTVYPSIDRSAIHLKNRYQVITAEGPFGLV